MNQDYFFCYDPKLFDFLSKRGFRFITKAQNVKNGKTFSLYEQSDKLRTVISEWKHIKNTKT